MLMNGGNLHPGAPMAAAPTAFSTMAGLSHEPPRNQAELVDREHQASSLAAAGMVADSISLTRSDPQRVHGVQHSQVLEAPPQLAGQVPPPSTSTSELESINWNLADLGQMHMDDLDMDFARLFDPAQEVANMQTEGSGWPSTGASDTTS